MRKISLFSITLLLFLVFPFSVSATLLINEFSSQGSSDWIELYNSGTDAIDLTQYRLRDSSTTNKLDLTGSLEPNSFAIFEWSDNLNNGGDIIKIIAVSDEASILDQVGYGSSGSNVPAPLVGQSAGRQADGGSTWVMFSIGSKGSTNATSSPVSLPTATPTLTPTPTKSPTPIKTATPTKSPTPSKIPTLAKSSTPTKSPTSKVTKTVESKNTASVLSEKTQKAKTTPSKQVALAEKNYPTAVFANTGKKKSTEKETGKVLVKESNMESNIIIGTSILGSVCLIACGILLYLGKRKDVQ